MENLGFHAVKLEWIYHADSHNIPVFGLSINVPLILLDNWKLALYVQSALCFMAIHMCMASQHSSASPSWNII